MQKGSTISAFGDSWTTSTKYSALSPGPSFTIPAVVNAIEKQVTFHVFDGIITYATVDGEIWKVNIETNNGIKYVCWNALAAFVFCIAINLAIALLPMQIFPAAVHVSIGIFTGFAVAYILTTTIYKIVMRRKVSAV